MDVTQQRLIRKETRIATCLCSVLPTLAVVFLFEPFPVPIGGAEGLVAFAVKSGGVAVLAMTTLMSLGTRAKVKKGVVAPLPRERSGWWVLVPRWLMLRALLFAVMAALLLASATALAADLLHWAPLQKSGFAAFNLVIGALIGALMTPLIQRAALMDGSKL